MKRRGPKREAPKLREIAERRERPDQINTWRHQPTTFLILFLIQNRCALCFPFQKSVLGVFFSTSVGADWYVCISVFTSLLTVLFRIFYFFFLDLVVFFSSALLLEFLFSFSLHVFFFFCSPFLLFQSSIATPFFLFFAPFLFLIFVLFFFFLKSNIEFLLLREITFVRQICSAASQKNQAK